MTHFATPQFWYCYRHLPKAVQDVADKNFAIMNEKREHPSLRLKKIGQAWTVRVGLHYRAMARERYEGLVWFWIGHHSQYEKLLKSS
jgi:hypothetical protein